MTKTYVPVKNVEFDNEELGFLVMVKHEKKISTYLYVNPKTQKISIRVIKFGFFQTIKGNITLDYDDLETITGIIDNLKDGE